MLADTHCHLDFNTFNSDRGQVLDRAGQAGVARLLNPGITLTSSRDAVRMAEEHAAVFAAVGVHPNEALTWQEDALKQLRTLAKHPKVVAIGEIGLDYYRDRAPGELQKHIFLQQLTLAAELSLPVIIHNRQATEDVLEILTGWVAELRDTNSPLMENPGVLHSYSDGEESAQRAMTMNFGIGISGTVTFHNASDLQRLVAGLPLECILVETDAPFLAPHPHRGRRNEPAHVRLVVEKVAALKNVDVGTIADITTANASRLFHW